MQTNMETISVQTPHGIMPAFLAYPQTFPSPAIILLQEAFGVNDHIKSVAVRFAEQGYFTIAPELYYRTAAPGFSGSYDDFSSLRTHFSVLTPENVESDLRSTFDWLAANPNVLSNRISSVGFCLGGWVSFVANSILPLRAAVAFYGSGIARTFEQYSPLQKAPLLLVWAGLDRSVKSEKRRDVSDALLTEKKNFVEILFSEADHGFFCEARSAYHPSSAAQAWSLTLSFLRQAQDKS